MKILIVLTAVLAASAEQTQLSKDFQDIINAIPAKEIEKVINNHLETDAAFAGFIKFVKSSEWRQFDELLHSEPVVQDFIKYLEKSGIPVRKYIADGRDWLKNAKPKQEPDENGCLDSLIGDIIDVLPADELLSVVQDKMTHSEAFQAFFQRLSGEEVRRMVEKISRLPKWQNLKARLKRFCIDVDKFFGMIKSFLGWN